MESEFEKRLRTVKPKSITNKERSMLWSNITEGIEVESYIAAHKKVSVPTLFGLRTRHVVAALLTGSFVFGSFATAAFADNSKPGDLLFPVDLAAERLRLQLASEENKAELRVKFASERLEEVRTILSEADASGSNASGDVATLSVSVSQTDGEAGTETAATTTEEVQDNALARIASHEMQAERTLDEVRRENAQEAFEIAFEYLTKSRKDLEDTGSDQNILAVDGFIDELEDLSSRHDLKRDRVVLDRNAQEKSLKAQGMPQETAEVDLFVADEEVQPEHAGALLFDEGVSDTDIVEERVPAATSADSVSNDSVEEYQQDGRVLRLSRIDVDVGTSTATITWRASRESSGRVEYAPKDSVTDEVFVEEGAQKSIEHEIKLTNLTPETAYEARLLSDDEFGNVGVSERISFETESLE